MKTHEEQQAFFEAQWGGMQKAAETGGVDALLAFLDAIEDPLERRVLSLFARQGLVMRDWEGRDLATYVGFARGAIGRILEEGRQAEDPDLNVRATHLANVISYNLAADLADCWPVDGLARGQDHFEAGLAAAKDCVRWREELGNGPGPMSMALWAAGMHELSLSDHDASVSSFERSLTAAREAAATDADFGVVLGRGYVGLARWLRGDEEGAVAYREALADFEAQLAEEDRKDDARFGIEQLEIVRSRYLPASSTDA